MACSIRQAILATSSLFATSGSTLSLNHLLCTNRW